uniref:Uncharacterized protein n=1 Tax=Panagrolaimus sp. PS1159 TaxID=55785 RepID=A0AC35GE87_9BILA
MNEIHASPQLQSNVHEHKNPEKIEITETTSSIDMTETTNSDEGDRRQKLAFRAGDIPKWKQSLLLGFQVSLFFKEVTANT